MVLFTALCNQCDKHARSVVGCFQKQSGIVVGHSVHPAATTKRNMPIPIRTYATTFLKD